MSKQPNRCVICGVRLDAHTMNDLHACDVERIHRETLRDLEAITAAERRNLEYKLVSR